jgi:hypothetical protein
MTLSLLAVRPTVEDIRMYTSASLPKRAASVLSVEWKVE